MKPDIRNRLLTLNQQFYNTVAEPFDATRQSWPKGNVRLLDFLPATRPLRVLDVGCGNGRFARIVASTNGSADAPIEYTGVDGNAQLLDLAREASAGLDFAKTEFHRADLADPDWPAVLREPHRHYDFIVCLATLQHMPGKTLREDLVRSLAHLLAPKGRLAISAWQFFSSERLSARLIDWSEVGVDEREVEPGDALLPWKQDVYAIRYVHQIDLSEMETLAASASLRIMETFRADGRSNDLNLYAVMEHQ